MTPSQPEFRTALLDAERPVPDGLLDGHGGAAGRRFSVYRNNVAVSLTEALQTGFPVLRKLLGEGTFDRLAGIYLRAHPPRSPLMMHYGQDMPAFLESFEPLAHLGYLPDIARLELALRASYHAADAAPADAATLGAMPAQDLVRTRVDLAPSLGLVPSRWPIHDIWRFNMVDGAPKPRAIAQDVVVLRAEFDPDPHPLPPGGHDFLAALGSGAPLGEAAAAAPDADPPALLSLLLSHDAITGFETIP